MRQTENSGYSLSPRVESKCFHNIDGRNWLRVYVDKLSCRQTTSFLNLWTLAMILENPGGWEQPNKAFCIMLNSHLLQFHVRHTTILKALCSDWGKLYGSARSSSCPMRTILNSWDPFKPLQNLHSFYYEFFLVNIQSQGLTLWYFHLSATIFGSNYFKFNKHLSDPFPGRCFQWSKGPIL